MENIEPKVIRATQFILEDETSKPRVGLIVRKAGPGLGLRDETGKSRVGLIVTKDGPAMTLLDKTGKAILSQPSKGRSCIVKSRAMSLPAVGSVSVLPHSFTL